MNQQVKNYMECYPHCEEIKILASLHSQVEQNRKVFDEQIEKDLKDHREEDLDIFRV